MFHIFNYTYNPSPPPPSPGVNYDVMKVMAQKLEVGSCYSPPPPPSVPLPPSLISFSIPLFPSPLPSSQALPLPFLSPFSPLSLPLSFLIFLTSPPPYFFLHPPSPPPPSLLWGRGGVTILLEGPLAWISSVLFPHIKLQLSTFILSIKGQCHEILQ
jgi:hypothetical protein